ncbi:MAG: hypothetical protein KGI54_17935, partial [Pseudomonadota bacterium]|nr:hypothetical protein [Pseudomonadota bacterium]
FRHARSRVFFCCGTSSVKLSKIPSHLNLSPSAEQNRLTYPLGVTVKTSDELSGVVQAFSTILAITVMGVKMSYI